MNIYLVEDCGNAPGRILAVIAGKEDAEEFAEMLGAEFSPQIIERKLWHGQPTNRGYNK